MQSNKKALLYGVLLWVVWKSIVEISGKIIPSTIDSWMFFLSMKIVLLAMLTIWLTVRYMQKVGNGTFTAMEGMIIGAHWMVIMIIFDLLFYTLRGSFDPASYFFALASSYIIVPFITITLMGWLRLKQR